MNSEFFEKLNEWIRDTESSVVNFLSAFAPWLAPIIPAYMTYSHATNVLGFPFLVALPAALVVEILGFSAVSTFLAFWFYNRRNVAATKKAPIYIVVVAFGFYLALILVSNVLIDASIGTKWELTAIVAVRALYTLQTIPAALIVAVRTQHRDLLQEISKERLESSRNKLESFRKVPERVETSVESSKKVPSDWRKIRPTLTDKQLRDIAHLTPDQMRTYASETDYTYKTISNWRSRARQELGIDSESN